MQTNASIKYALKHSGRVPDFRERCQLKALH